jgi:large subunit ribosomal protein L23
MALFGRKKDTEQTESAATAETQSAKPAKPLATDRDLAAVIVKPHLTEKSVKAGEQNVYTLEVKRDATKYEVRDAVKALYNVTPVKVNIVNKRPAKRQVGFRNTLKHEKGMKKAYVYLKKGDSISLV